MSLVTLSHGSNTRTTTAEGTSPLQTFTPLQLAIDPLCKGHGKTVLCKKLSEHNAHLIDQTKSKQPRGKEEDGKRENQRGKEGEKGRKKKRRREEEKIVCRVA
ncbi:hypothetical protein AVEN_130825-1 [Araneus ventricosus]|uniref:Uncharacterized protein n=1 Tax=Araneus ventricosus TaxID=182803 RepID=A0A4Y2JVF9_ARAVE|nr:hypothetical protein AVEN_130825-1 [Araneus ventricosus]